MNTVTNHAADQSKADITNRHITMVFDDILPNTAL